MGWFEEIPRETIQEVSQAGRDLFPSSFARGGGLIPTMFAETPKEAWKTAWRKKHKVGSFDHIQNLERMAAADPGNAGVQKALEKARQAKPKISALKAVGNTALGAAFIGLPFFTTPGGLTEKSKATAAGAVGMVGWEVGAKLGAATGAAIGNAIGTAILPGIGTVIGSLLGEVGGYVAGAFGGSIAMEQAAHGVMGITDRMAESERKRRGLNWVGDTSAFNTRKASTMRQQSLQLMNSGAMNARSMLGREGVMLHQ